MHLSGMRHPARTGPVTCSCRPGGRHSPWAHIERCRNGERRPATYFYLGAVDRAMGAFSPAERGPGHQAGIAAAANPQDRCGVRHVGDRDPRRLVDRRRASEARGVRWRERPGTRGTSPTQSCERPDSSGDLPAHSVLLRRVRSGSPCHRAKSRFPVLAILSIPTSRVLSCIETTANPSTPDPRCATRTPKR